MDAVKVAFGVMMLGVAVWMVGRILPGPVTLALWAVIAFVAGYYLFTQGDGGAKGGAKIARRGLAGLAVLYGVLMLVGALAGHSNPLQPLAGFGAARDGASAKHLEFTRIKTVADLDRALEAAKAAGRPVMLDFYADWCVSCKEMEHLTFTDPGVQAALAPATTLQADVTANDEADQALLQRFGILGPPTIVFFGPEGAERTDYRVVGFKAADEFRAHVTKAFGSGS
jgi:thiol:disulfide interchange protein DsbD